MRESSGEEQLANDDTDTTSPYSVCLGILIADTELKPIYSNSKAPGVLSKLWPNRKLLPFTPSGTLSIHVVGTREAAEYVRHVS